MIKRLLCATALTLTLGSGGQSAAAPGPHYIALGDSRAAAPTWTSPLTGDGCGRTTDAYPGKAAALLGVTFRSVACAGATTEDVIDGQTTGSGRKIAPQIAALTTDTKLVTLSIGGNDIKWWSLVAPCFSPAGDANCRTNPAVDHAIDSALRSLPAKVDRVLAAVVRRASHARIVVVGHGGIFGPSGCFPEATISDGDAAFVARFFDRFNTVLRDAAGRAAGMFIDVSGAAVGHDVCSRAPWFAGNWPDSVIQVRHPTPLGSKGIARLIVERLGATPV